MRDVALYAADPQNTRPIFLIDFGAEQFSTSGDQPPYLGGLATLSPAQDWLQVVVSLPADSARVSNALAGTYRQTPVTVGMIPAVEYYAVFEQGYAEPDYANQGLIKGPAVAVFDGLVDSFALSANGQIKFTARHKILSKASIPGLRFGAPINYHCPQAGQVIQFKSTLYTLEGPKK